MKVKDVMEIGFDPAKSTPEIQEIFNCRPAKILWCAIKSSHIVSQYFNQDVLSVGKELDDKRGNYNFHEFMKITAPLSMQNFGQVSISDSPFGPGSTVPDNEFWADIYFMTKGRYFETKIKNKE